MMIQALKSRLFKNSNLLQVLVLAISALTFTACEKDETERFYFDAEAQKVKDEGIIRQYFRDNNVDTTAVVKSESGLYYLEVTEGEGEQIMAGDSVEAHYIGRFVNNLIFDSSYNRGRTSTFVVAEGNVIDGWVEGLQMMRVGGEGYLYVPSHLAYGVFGSQNGSIPSNSVLVFNIEILNKK